MEQKAKRRVHEIESSRRARDHKIQEQMARREYELMLQKERENVLRSQRQDTVQRIMRTNEYKKHQILLKIQQDNDRCARLRAQKQELLQARRQARDDATLQKQTMQQKFEQLQNKGAFNVSCNRRARPLTPHFLVEPHPSRVRHHGGPLQRAAELAHRPHRPR